MSVSATQLRLGMVTQHRTDPHRLMELTQVTPGNWRGFVRTKLRNLRTGLQTEQRFRSEDQVERLILEQHAVQYLYQDGTDYDFMNVETFEQIVLTRETLGDAGFYLSPNVTLMSNFIRANHSVCHSPKPWILA